MKLETVPGNIVKMEGCGFLFFWTHNQPGCLPDICRDLAFGVDIVCVDRLG